MTEAQVIWEYRQIQAWNEEAKTGKPSEGQQGQTMYDDSYGEYLRSLGVTPEFLESQGMNSYG